MIRLIRLKISEFIRKYKYKIQDLAGKLVMVAIVILFATIVLPMLSSMNGEDTPADTVNVYKPMDTIIQGSDISKEQYETDSNLVNTFLEHCNNGNVDLAYSLLTDECKEKIYPTIDIFRDVYYNTIFSKKRECSMQAWISTKGYTVYQVRYANNMLATGTYDENNVYEDYLTLSKENDIEKISIGEFVGSEECNITASTNEIEMVITKKVQCISNEEYEIKIKNKTDKTILVNNLTDSKSIKLIATGDIEYFPYLNEIFIFDLLINPGETKTTTIKFKKSLSSNKESKRIEFSNIIRDYYTYANNREEVYSDFTSINIELEG